MLTLTPKATTVIRALIEGSELPDSAGLRIASTNNGQQALTVEPAPTPDSSDQIVEDSGARVFVENVAAGMIGDGVLDADVDEQGNVAFTLTGPGPEV
ncbi:MAG: Fe-S cluster assembly protein HesB [Acidimicrobiales bacterium]